MSTTLEKIADIPASFIRCEGLYMGVAYTAMAVSFPLFLIFTWLVPILLTRRLDPYFRHRRYMTHRQLTLDLGLGVAFFTRGWWYCLAATRTGGLRFSKERGIEKIDSRPYLNLVLIGFCYVATISILVFYAAVAALAPAYLSIHIHDKVFNLKPEWKAKPCRR